MSRQSRILLLWSATASPVSLKVQGLRGRCQNAYERFQLPKSRPAEVFYQTFRLAALAMEHFILPVAAVQVNPNCLSLSFLLRKT